MKKLILLSVYLIFTCYLEIHSQELNKDGNGYTKVIQTKLSTKTVYQKVNEWIVENYNSAKNVLQLNSEDKVILKGNYKVTFTSGKYSFPYTVHNSLSISIRENRYKIDLIPSKITYELNELDSSVLSLYLNPQLDIDSFMARVKKNLKNLGYTDKKINKLITKMKDGQYDDYLLNKKNWDNTISSTIKSISDYVENTDDW